MDELNKYSKRNPFKVPPGYFESFADQIINKIVSYEKISESKIKYIWKPILVVAASFILIFSFWFLVLKKIETKNIVSKNFNKINDIEFRITELNTEELIDLVVETDDGNTEVYISNTDINNMLNYIDETSILMELEANQKESLKK